MTVRRIVAKITTPDPQKARRFYGQVLGLEIVMDHGWIVTFADDGQAAPQVSFAGEGGGGAPVPDLSVEVDDVDEVYSRATAAGFERPRSCRRALGRASLLRARSTRKDRQHTRTLNCRPA